MYPYPWMCGCIRVVNEQVNTDNRLYPQTYGYIRLSARKKVRMHVSIHGCSYISGQFTDISGQFTDISVKNLCTDIYPYPRMHGYMLV